MFDRPVSEIAAYFVRPRTEWLRRLFGWPSTLERKAWPDDKAELIDPWVFADFWRRLGITYPETEPANRSYSLAVQFADPGSPALPADTSLD